MIDVANLEVCKEQLDSLRSVIVEAQGRSIADPPDALFFNNQNVFIKAFFVSACSVLEAFIKSLALDFINVVQGRINAANVPFNFVAWASDNSKARLDFRTFVSSKGMDDISEVLSPNYYKTLKAFEKIGVNLACADIEAFKDIITSRVDKRNKIVHHNDDALDLSFGDLISVIDEFKAYAEKLYERVSADPHS